MERTCKKCGKKKPNDHFPIHYEWCYECLDIKPQFPITEIYPSSGRICNICHKLKTIEQFDSAKWIYQFPNFSFVTCIDCRYKVKSTYYKKKAILEEIKCGNKIIEEDEWRKFRSENREVIDSIKRNTGLTNNILYKNRKYVKLYEVYFNLKRLIKTKENEKCR